VGREVDGMKDFDKPLVTISQEDYDQLQECKALINMLWRRFCLLGNGWPKEFRLPRGKSFRDFLGPEHSEDFQFYRFTQRVDVLMDFDDSE
jgi:hypothetical protein